MANRAKRLRPKNNNTRPNKGGEKARDNNHLGRGGTHPGGGGLTAHQSKGGRATITDCQNGHRDIAS